MSDDAKSEVPSPEESSDWGVSRPQTWLPHARPDGRPTVFGFSKKSEMNGSTI